MTAVIGAIPTRRPRIPGAVTMLASRAAKSAVTRARAAADRLSGSLLTIAGLACFDVGAFEANSIVGWVVTGVTVLALDWKLE